MIQATGKGKVHSPQGQEPHGFGAGGAYRNSLVLAAAPLPLAAPLGWVQVNEDGFESGARNRATYAM